MSELAAADRNGKPVGAFLRKTRESLGLQLQDAARVTRISKMYLIAMEEDKFEKLPNGAYLKGFLRLYATFLGLSGDDVIARYERTVSPQPHQVPPVPPTKNIEGIAKVKRGRRRHWLIPALLFSLVIFAALLFQEDHDRPTVPQQAAVTTPAPAAAPPAPTQTMIVPNDRIPSLMPAETLPTTDELGAGSNEQKPEGIVLKLRFNQDSWLSITIDDNVSQHYELKAGDVIEWKASRAFTVELGNAGAVEAEFNGKTLKPFGEAGVPVHLVLKGDGGQDQ